MNKIQELIKKAEDKVNSTMLSNRRKTEINLILLAIQKEVINYMHSSKQFKEKPYFAEWLRMYNFKYKKNGLVSGEKYYTIKNVFKEYQKWISVNF